jgi:putative transposase
MSRPKRLPGFAYKGPNRYFLTFCTLQRARRFTEAEDVDPLVEQFLRSATAEGMEITVYCVMPDHMHLLATGLAEWSDLRAFVADAKKQTGWAFRRQHRQRLWQEGYYERILREAEPTWNVVRYIVNNPVRAELVERPEDYPWWGSQAYSRREVLEFVMMVEGGDGRPW